MEISDQIIALGVFGLLVLFVLALLIGTCIRIRKFSNRGLKRSELLLPSKDLKESDLNEVQQLLHKHHFNTKEYRKLGLSLGLLHRTLDVIEANHVHNMERCFHECLVKWLHKVDDVGKKGGPTWLSLTRALREINEISTADAIEKEKHIPCQILCTHKNALIQSIQKDASGIAKLVSLEIDDCRNLHSLARDVQGTANEVYESVHVAVFNDYKNLRKFIAVLKKYAATVSVATTILKEIESTEELMQRSDIEICVEGECTFYLPISKVQKCQDVRSKWVSTIMEIIDAMEGVSPEKMKEFFEMLCPYLKAQLSSCTKVAEIVMLISSSSSLTNLKLLEGAAKHFKIQEAQQHITTYREEISSFMGNFLTDYCGEYFSNPSPLKSGKATFYVGKNVDEVTIKDVENIIEFTFDQLSMHVNVSVVRAFKSFTVTCSFPPLLSEHLIASAVRNQAIEYLQDKEVYKLTVGYSTVYDMTQLPSFTYDNAVLYCSEGTMKQLLIATYLQLNIKIDEKRENKKKNKKKKQLLEKQLKMYENDAEKKDKDNAVFKNMRQKALIENEYLKNQIQDLTKSIMAAEKEKELSVKELDDAKTLAKEREQKIKELEGKVLDMNQELEVYREKVCQLEQLEEPEHVVDEENVELDDDDFSVFEGTGLMALPGSVNNIENDGKIEWHDTWIDITSPSTSQFSEILSEITERHETICLQNASPEAIMSLIPSLLKLETVKGLWISSSSLDTNCFECFATLLQNNMTLKELSFNSSSVTDEAVAILAKSLHKNKTLTSLSFQNNEDMTHHCITALAHLIAYNSTLKNLTLQEINIPDIAILTALLSPLITNKTITLHLDRQYEPACKVFNKYMLIKDRTKFD